MRLDYSWLCLPFVIGKIYLLFTSTGNLYSFVSRRGDNNKKRNVRWITAMKCVVRSQRGGLLRVYDGPKNPLNHLRCLHCRSVMIGNHPGGDGAIIPSLLLDMSCLPSIRTLFVSDPSKVHMRRALTYLLDPAEDEGAPCFYCVIYCFSSES